MGKSDRLLVPWYQYNVKIRGDVALLGFSKNIIALIIIVPLALISYTFQKYFVFVS